MAATLCIPHNEVDTVHKVHTALARQDEYDSNHFLNVVPFITNTI